MSPDKLQGLLHEGCHVRYVDSGENIDTQVGLIFRSTNEFSCIKTGRIVKFNKIQAVALTEKELSLNPEPND